MFNAHRVFYAQTIMDSFPEMDLVEFSVINKNGDNIKYNVDVHEYDHEPESDYHSLRFGLFVFKKRVVQIKTKIPLIFKSNPKGTLTLFRFNRITL